MWKTERVNGPIIFPLYIHVLNCDIVIPSTKETKANSPVLKSGLG